MSRYVAAIWKCRYFWLSLVRMDLRTRYRRSVLGLGWSLLNPILMTAVMCVVFPRFLPIASVGEYAPMVLVGLCFWNFITSSTKLGTQCLFQGERYIRQYPAPIAIYPLRIALGSSFHFSVALLVVVLLRLSVIGFSGMSSFVSLVPTFLLIFVLGWSLAVLAGFLTAYFPDMEHLTDVGLQILFYGTPIIYPTDAIQGKLGWLIRLNPLTTFIELLRAPLLRGEFPDASLYGAAAISAAAIAGMAVMTLTRFEKKIIFQL
ncbi:MAG: ABC transporter permease [Planctomycetia bacterium]|nr:ABC transporter permease [Planctomycetia bacterium]